MPKRAAISATGMSAVLSKSPLSTGKVQRDINSQKTTVLDGIPLFAPEPFDAPSAPLFPRKGMEEHRKRATRSISPIHTPTPGEQK